MSVARENWQQLEPGLYSSREPVLRISHFVSTSRKALQQRLWGLFDCSFLVFYGSYTVKIRKNLNTTSLNRKCLDKITFFKELNGCLVLELMSKNEEMIVLIIYFTIQTISFLFSFFLAKVNTDTDLLYTQDTVHPFYRHTS